MKKLLLPILCAGFLRPAPTTGARRRTAAAGPGDLPEYTYSQVEFRRLVSGQFRGWTVSEAIAGGDIADATQTRTVAGMNWFRPVDFHVETPWGRRLDYGEPVSVRGAEGFSALPRPATAGISLTPTAGRSSCAVRSTSVPTTWTTRPLRSTKRVTRPVFVRRRLERRDGQPACVQRLQLYFLRRQAHRALPR